MGKELVMFAAHATSFDNLHTIIFFVASISCLMVSLIAPGSRRDINWQRRIFWGGTLGAALCAFFAAWPDVATGSALAGLAVVLMALPAYFNSQYIKVGGRVIAFHSVVDPASDGASAGGHRGDQPYSSSVSAAKLWWLLVVCSLIAAVNIYAYLFDDGKKTYGLGGMLILVAIGALIGFGDGMARQRVARGQYAPFVVATLISAGLVPLSYLIARSIAAGIARPK